MGWVPSPSLFLPDLKTLTCMTTTRCVELVFTSSFFLTQIQWGRSPLHFQSYQSVVKMWWIGNVAIFSYRLGWHTIIQSSTLLYVRYVQILEFLPFSLIARLHPSLFVSQELIITTLTIVSHVPISAEKCDNQLFWVSALYYFLADGSFSKWFVQYLIYKLLDMPHFQGTYQTIYHQYAMMYSLRFEI
jgi:hypothetical protein